MYLYMFCVQYIYMCVCIISMCILGAWHVCIWAHCMSMQYVCTCLLFQTHASNICLFICIYLWFSIYMRHCEYVAACMTMSMCVSMYVWTCIHINVHCLKPVCSYASICVCELSVYMCALWVPGRACWAEETAGGVGIRLGVDIVGYWARGVGNRWWEELSFFVPWRPPEDSGLYLYVLEHHWWVREWCAQGRCSVPLILFVAGCGKASTDRGISGDGENKKPVPSLLTSEGFGFGCEVGKNKAGGLPLNLSLSCSALSHNFSLIPYGFCTTPCSTV